MSGEGFLRAILDNPDDVAVRLIYSDWLEEQGESDRAEFIRIQCRLADEQDRTEDWTELARLRAREKELLARYGAEWRRPIASLVVEARFCRGFIEHVTMKPQTILANVGEIRRLAPLRYVRIEQGVLHRFAEATRTQAAELPGLDLSLQFLRIDFRDLTRLLATMHFRDLRRLDLRGLGLRNNDLLDLAVYPGLRLITHLDLSSNQLTMAGVDALLQSPHLDQLEELRLANNLGISRQGLERLAGRQSKASWARVLRRAAGLLPPVQQESYIVKQMLRFRGMFNGMAGQTMLAAALSGGLSRELDKGLNDSRKYIRIAAIEATANLRFLLIQPFLPALVQRLYDGVPEVRQAAARALGRLAEDCQEAAPQILAKHWQLPLSHLLGELTRPGFTPEQNLLGVLERNTLQIELAGEVARIAWRRLVWRAGQHRDPAKGMDEATRWASMGAFKTRPAGEAITTLLDLVEERARSRAEPGEEPDHVGQAARVREGAWLLARVCELLLRK